MHQATNGIGPFLLGTFVYYLLIKICFWTCLIERGGDGLRTVREDVCRESQRKAGCKGKAHCEAEVLRCGAASWACSTAVGPFLSILACVCPRPPRFGCISALDRVGSVQDRAQVSSKV